MLRLLILIASVDLFVLAEIISDSDLDDFVLESEILRNTVSFLNDFWGDKKSINLINMLHQRSDITTLEKWPEVLNDDYISSDRKMSSRKKITPVNLYRSRAFDYKDRVEKKNNMNNNSESNKRKYETLSLYSLFLRHSEVRPLPLQDL
jgi:hypothetical protein